MWSELAASFQQGDSYIYVMLVLAFIGVVVLFERIIMLLFVYNIDFNKFMMNLRKMVKAEDNDRAMNLCKKVSKTSLPYICLRALEAAETDPTTIEGTIEEEAIGFLPNLETRMNILPAIATLILMIGVLGTIDGLWGAFTSLEVLDTTQKQASLAYGIAGSLNHAALGLLFAMLLLAGQYFIRGISLRLVDRIHHGVAILSNLLVPKNMVAYAGVPAAFGASGSNDISVSGAEEYMNAGDDYGASSNSSNNDGANDASFNEASVDDIKDEEEII